MKTLTFPVSQADLAEVGKSLTQFVGFGGMTMTTVGASFGIVPVEDVLSGKALPIEIVATSDGRGACTREWHQGEENDLVYVERYSLAGREFHGWIDSETRKLVQVG